MTDAASKPPTAPGWLHYWAILTVCATVPLLLLGAEVTTMQAGMVDPQGFRLPWHILTVPLREMGLGFLVEHSHRLAGYIVGACAIVLAAGLWLKEPRRWLRWLGVAALAAVIVQGLLGGFRVELHALMGRGLALIHGLFAQVVFALLVSAALFTRRGWAFARQSDPSPVDWMRRWSIGIVALVYLEIILGAVNRHTESRLGPRLHLLLAFGLVAVVAGVTRRVFESSRPGYVKVPATILASLVGLQVLLGVEAWMFKFGPVIQPPPATRPAHTEIIRSLHYLVGSLILATAVVLALQSFRGRPELVAVVGSTAEPLEGAA